MNMNPASPVQQKAVPAELKVAFRKYLMEITLLK